MANTAEVLDLQLGRIKPGDNDHKSFPDSEMRELANSITAHGLAQPITVRPVGATFYELVAGERRFRAFQLLGREFIPCIIRELSDEEASAIMLAENTHRADLSPIEEARGYRSRMDRFELTAQQVAEWAHVTPERVKGRLELLELRDDAQHLVTT
ncbi:MAG: ParB/RepB/Spo0J family partition protein, partial [Acidimicrobiales bacterium]